MSTPLVVLTAQHVALGPANAYATRLASALGVPVRLLPASFTEALSPPDAPEFTPPGAAPRPAPLAAALATQRALLLVLPRPTSAEAPPGWLAGLTARLLQAAPQALLVVPPQALGQVPPLRLLLATDGEPFRLAHGRRALHALVFALPVQLTVLHVRLPGQAPAGDEALQSVLACGLATRSVALDMQELAADSPAEGIARGLALAHADLLVLVVRPRSLRAGRFAQSTPAVLAQRSPVPVLLLVAAEA